MTEQQQDPLWLAAERLHAAVRKLHREHGLEDCWTRELDEASERLGDLLYPDES